MLGTSEPRLKLLDPRLLAATTDVVAGVRIDRLQADVAAIAHPRGRLHAPEAMVRTEDMVITGLRDAGWTAEAWPFTMHNVAGNLDHGDYRQTVYPELRGVNVVAIKPGETSGSAILVGAHLDTVPESPGADDNGSGIAALLELARLLGPYRFRRAIILVGFDMEEIGLVGARALAPRLLRERTVRGAIIFESMAYTTTSPHSQIVPPGMATLYRGQMARLRRRQIAGDFAATIYNGRALTLARCMGEGITHLAGPDASLLLRDPNDIPLLGPIIQRAVPAVRNFSRSDHFVFWRAGIPAVLVTDTANFRNPHYHRPTDTPDTLDYERLGVIVGATAITLARTAGLIGDADRLWSSPNRA